MKQKKIFIFIIFILIFFAKNIDTATVGSDTAVNKFSTQQILNNSDRIACFAALNSGFKINSADATGTFDSIFPVSGDIEIGLGTLTLSQDLILYGDTSVKSIGTIYGNSHTLELSHTCTALPTHITVTQDDINVTALTSQSFSGDVYSVDWSHDNQYIAVTIQKSGGSNGLFIYSFNGSSLTFKKGDYIEGNSMTIYTVRWNPLDYYLAISTTDEKFYTYEYTPGSNSLTQQDSLGHMIYAFDWHPGGNYIATGRSTSYNEIATYYIYNDGNIDSTPRDDINLSPSRNPRQESLNFRNDGNYFVVGTEATSNKNNVLIYSFNSENGNISLNAGYEYTSHVNAVSWNPSYPDYIAVGLNGTSQTIRILKHNSSTGTLTEVAAYNTSVITHALDWSPNGKWLAVGKAYSTVAQNHEFEVYYFDTSTEILSKSTGFDYANKVDAVRFSPNGNYIAIGSFTNVLEIYLFETIAGSSETSFTFDDINIVLNTDTTIQNYEITLSGVSSIDGQGHTLHLDPTCQLIVDSNTNLLLKDITISGIKTNIFDTTDNSSTVTLQNCTWILDDNFILDYGALHIKNNFEMFGQGNTFSYESIEQSTIYPNSNLILHDDTTLYYNPIDEAKDLIHLSANTSQITLKGATLHTTRGINLTKGILLIENNSTLLNDSVLTGEEIVFGDGISIENNLDIQITPGASVNFAGGKIIHKEAS